jgi:hypothetical protein
VFLQEPGLTNLSSCQARLPKTFELFCQLPIEKEPIEKEPIEKEPIEKEPIEKENDRGVAFHFISCPFVKSNSAKHHTQSNFREGPERSSRFYC